MQRTFKFSSIDSSNYTIADHFASLTHRSFFLTGKAGTGKTTFLKQLRKTTSKQLAVVAPTGVAAINAGGVTIHSFFQLPFTPFVPTPEGRLNLTRKIKMSGRKRKVLQELELLVIDEISMVRADVLDEIDTVLRHYRFRHNEPFGGVQVILIGDLYQLAPVAIAEEWDVLSPYYPSPYFFDSQVVREHPLLYVEFDKIFRQSDATFIRLLNAVRDDKLTQEDLCLLQKQYDPQFNISKHPDYILLTTHNAKADRVNEQEMARLKGKEYTFEAVIKGEFPEKSYPNNATLRLKKGAKVMFIANDTETPRKYFNGKIGTIAEINPEHILVHCDDCEDDIEVSHEIWENIRFSVNEKTKQIEEKNLGTFKQYPLRLAWAITIHKSQGLTFDKVAIDIESAFTAGQVYVALSRCRSLGGIALLSNLNRSSLTVDKNVVEYSSLKPTNDILQHQLQIDEARFNQELISSVFNFSFCIGQINQLRTFVKKEEDLFNSKSQKFLKELQEAVNKISEIGNKFRRQLQILYQDTDSKKLSQRIKAASEYFTKELDKIIELITTSPATTDDFESAEEYNFCLQSLYDELTQKRYIIHNIRKDFSTEHYLAIKDKYSAPKLDINTFKSKRGKRNLKKEILEEIFNDYNTRRKGNAKTALKKGTQKSTYEVTYDLYQQGKNIAEIAAARGYAESTIVGHITKFIRNGKVSVYDFVTKEQLEVTREFFNAGGTMKDVFEALDGNLSYDEIRIIQAGIECEIS